MNQKYDITDLAKAVKTSNSWREVCESLGANSSAGVQSHLKKRAVVAQIDFTHFKGQGWSKGTVLGFKNPIEYYLQLNGPYISSHDLRIRLLKEGIKDAKCEICSLYLWQGKGIPLELDHINGNHYDNRLWNLRILCCNCHAQTDNYGSKKLRKV
jgi:hypothetical protein